MKNNLRNIKIFILTVLLSSGVFHVLAQAGAPLNPPSSNTNKPINVSDFQQIKSGSLQLNTTTVSPNPYGLTAGQGIRVSSLTPNWTRIYLNETGDGAGNWSGVALRKASAFMGGLFKKGDPVEANNDITIWNSTQPVVTVKQSGATQFAGTVKIAGGNPQTGAVLVSSADGLGSWSSGATRGTYSLGPRWYYGGKFLGQTDWNFGTEQDHIGYASCPDGWLAVGFFIYTPFIVFPNKPSASSFKLGGGTLYCRQVLVN